MTRSRVGDSPPLPAACFSLGVVTALFHDFGYLRKRGDRRHRYGAEYTQTHVSRGSQHLRQYLPRIGLKRYANAGATLVHYTGYERPRRRFRSTTRCCAASATCSAPRTSSRRWPTAVTWKNAATGSIRNSCSAASPAGSCRAAAPR